MMIQFLVLIISILIVLFFSLAVHQVKIFKKYKNLKKFLKNYSNIIISARYGNLNLSSLESTDKSTRELLKNTKALLDSVLDRDKMIKEYIEREKESQLIKQDFISSLTHDLKVPIIAQDNTYNLFLDGKIGELTPEQKHAIEILKISNNDLKNLTMDLLDVYRLDKTEIELNLKRADIRKIILEVVAQNDSILKIRNKRIIQNIEEKEIFSNVDEFLIKRVLNNLISNAIFYGKNSENIYIDLTIENQEIKISLTDEGDGIEEEEIKEIFKKYYSGAKKYSNIGVGLGLYIANRIVLAHGGKINVKNTQDKGACFTVVLKK